MKKIFTLLAVAAMAITAQAQETLWLAYNDGTQVGTTLTDFYTGTEIPYADGLKFENNGVTMYLAKDGKEYAGGNTNAELGKPIKLSNGAANLIVLPENFVAGKIVFYGYSNKENTTSWISNISREVEGTLVPVYQNEGDNALPSVTKEDFGPMTKADMPKIECQFTYPVTGNLWFKNGGSQPAIFIEIYADDPAGIANIAADNNAPVEYFNLQGVRVDNPANGLYIRRQGNNVAKVVVK